MNHKLKWLLILIVAVLTVKQTIAQESKLLSLKEAIDLSLKNSKYLQIDASKLVEATAKVKEAKDRQLPDFTVSGSYLWLPVDPNIKLKTGSDSSGGGSGPAVHQAVYGMATLSLPIYAGGRIKYGIESAKYLEQAAKLDADHDHDEVIFNTMKAYLNLYKSFEAVKLVKENLHSSLSRDTNFISLEKNGLLARNDLLKSQLQTSNIELSLMDAENNNKLAMINMNLMLGLPENDLIILDTSSIDKTQDLKSFLDYETAALQNRKDIQAAGFRQKAAATGIKSAKAETYPTIALTGGFIAADIPDFLTMTNAVNIGVGVKYNLASLWKTNTKLQEAKSKEKQAIVNEEILNDDVRLTINQDYQNYLLSRKKIEVYQKALEQANENYRITNNKYVNSLVTLNDLLDADVLRLQAQLNIVSVRADALLAYKKILLTAGLLSN
ncbi:MAG: TolC family protein [Ferruginibacter sp.]